jgi:hypothetical protein
VLSGYACVFQLSEATLNSYMRRRLFKAIGETDANLHVPYADLPSSIRSAVDTALARHSAAPLFDLSQSVSGLTPPSGETAWSYRDLLLSLRNPRLELSSERGATVQAELRYDAIVYVVAEEEDASFRERQEQFETFRDELDQLLTRHGSSLEEADPRWLPSEFREGTTEPRRTQVWLTRGQAKMGITLRASVQSEDASTWLSMLPTSVIDVQIPEWEGLFESELQVAGMRAVKPLSFRPWFRISPRFMLAAGRLGSTDSGAVTGELAVLTSNDARSRVVALCLSRPDEAGDVADIRPFTGHGNFAMAMSERTVRDWVVSRWSEPDCPREFRMRSRVQLMSDGQPREFLVELVTELQSIEDVTLDVSGLAFEPSGRRLPDCVRASFRANARVNRVWDAAGDELDPGAWPEIDGGTEIDYATDIEVHPFTRLDIPRPTLDGVMSPQALAGAFSERVLEALAGAVRAPTVDYETVAGSVFMGAGVVVFSAVATIEADA